MGRGGLALCIGCFPVSLLLARFVHCFLPFFVETFYGTFISYIILSLPWGLLSIDMRVSNHNGYFRSFEGVKGFDSWVTIVC
jgi:hypothetical protein